MKLLRLWLAAFTCITFGLAQQTDLTAIVSHLPVCAQSCLIASMADSSCSLTDLACICADSKLQLEVEGCVMHSCTLRQSLTTKNMTTTVCHVPRRSKNNEVRVSNIIVATVAAACMLPRIVYKGIFSIGELGWDDWAVFGATAAGVPSVIMIDQGLVPNGLGEDVWTVPFDKITEFVRILFVLECLYFAQIALVKLTLLLFFLRIFPKPIIRKLIWATIIFDGLWATAFVITGIFQCRPISYYWLSWDKERDGTCVNINALAWTNAIISLVLDVWMLVLPLYEICHLQLSWRKKIGVAFMFFVGTCVTVVSALRVRSLVYFAASKNPTWDQTDVVSWSNIEINVGIICACLPALRVIFVRMFPKMFGSFQGTSQNQYAKYGSRSREFGGSALSRSGRHMNSKNTGTQNSITYTKSFTIQRDEGDEISLVHPMELNEFQS